MCLPQMDLENRRDDCLTDLFACLTKNKTETNKGKGEMFTDAVPPEHDGGGGRDRGKGGRWGPQGG